MMSHNPYEAYQESEVLMADPVELVRILYRAAVTSVENARQYLRCGDIRARSREISKAASILTELSLSVDREKGGALGRSLVELYDYMQRRLIEANVEQSEPPLAEVAQLLGTLLEAWTGLQPERQWQGLPFVPAAAHLSEYAGQSWTL